MPGYFPTGEDRRIKEVHGDWVHYNDGSCLSGGIQDNNAWQTSWKTMAVMPAKRYDAPSGRVWRHFVHSITVELTGVRQRCWNSERFIIFQTVTLQRARHVTKSCEISRQIYQRLDAWEAGEHKILVEVTVRTCTQYLSTSRGDYSPEHKAKIYNSLVLRGKLQSEVQWITEREKGGVFQTGETCPKTGELVFGVLFLKHPKSCSPTARILEAYGSKPTAKVSVDIIDTTVATVAR